MKKISIFVITILLSGSLLIIPPSDSGNLIENDTSINKNTTNVENQVLIEEPVNDFNKNGFGNYFTANHGQVGSDDVKYYIHGKGVWFTSTGVVFVLREPVDNQPRGFDESKIPDFDSCKKPETVQYKSEVVTFEFVNCNNVNHVGVGELPHKSNFFYGNNSSKWCTDVPNFREIYFESIYDKIDLRYYFNDNGLKYDFIVNPGGDPNDIAIKVEGAEELILGIGNSGAMTQPPEFNTPLTTQHTPLNNHSDSSKDTLTIKTGLNDIVDSDLFVYQEHNDIITEVTAGFRLINSDCYGFSILDDYDKLKPLVIDPLIFSTYFGGKEADNCKDMQIDKHGNLYMTGWTTSSNFPVSIGSNDTSFNGGYDIFITKLNSDGTSILYSTFIGGSNYDGSFCIAIDTNGSAYISGYTASSDFPTTSGAYDEDYNSPLGSYDIIVCKLTPMGNKLNFSTYVGGTGHEFSSDITLDEQRNVYITGGAYGDSYPTTPGVYKSTQLSNSDYNVIISKLNSTGTDLLYSTLIGTSAPSYSQGSGIALDNKSNICVAGTTYSTAFPTTAGAYKETFTPSMFGYEGFLLKLNSNMSSLLFSTFFGTLKTWGVLDWDNNVLMDNEGSFIITANTMVNDFTTTTDAYDRSFNGITDAVIIKLNNNLSALLYSTYIGGKGEDYAYGSIIDDHGNLYIVGETNSSDFPMLEGVYDPIYNGNKDVFVARLNMTDSQLRYSTYIGGSNNEYGVSIARDENGTIYIAGSAEQGFPTTSGSYSPSFNGGTYDAFALKLEPKSNPIISELNISESSIYRSRSIEVFSNASDNEDLEKCLTPYFGYSPPDHADKWFDQLLSAPVFVNDRWQSTFYVPIEARLGYYDFRVRYNDTDNMWSRWHYFNDSLLVMNNPPEIEYFNLSTNTAAIGDELSLFVNGSDVEDDLEALIFQPQYKFSADTIWNDFEYDKAQLKDSKWEYTMTIDPDMEYGYHDLRVCVNDTDYDFSDWLYLPISLLILPGHPKIISINTSENIIYRTEIFYVYINCTDPDSPIDELAVELQDLPENVSIWNDLSVDVIEDRLEAYGKSKKSWALGNYNFRARATDLEDNTSPWFYLNDSFTVLNNIPELTRVEGIPLEMYRGNSVSISVDAIDVEDDENELSIEFEYKESGGSVWLSTYFSQPAFSDKSWRFDLALPLTAKLGTYSFRARTSDLDNDWSDYVYYNNSLTVINAVPVVSSFDQTPNDIYRTEKVKISIDGSDLESPKSQLECMIYYLEPGDGTWELMDANFNESSDSWGVELLTTKTSGLGNYSFKVQLKDLDGAMSKEIFANDTVLVLNNLPEISSDLDEIQVGKNQYILKLTDYGFDVETSKTRLRWSIDESTINNKLSHVEVDNIGNQEITIYPVKSTEGKDDITITLMDADNGKAVKRDITINVNSKSGGGVGPDDDEGPGKILTSGNSYWIYIIILIIVIVLIVLFLMYRRKRAKEKVEEEMEKEAEKEEDQAESHEEIETPLTEEVPAAEPAPVIEEPTVPVVMPAQEETPQLPISTVDTETGAGSREPEVPETETEAEKKIEETEDEGREPDGQNACGAEC